MEWNKLESIEGLKKAVEESNDLPVLLFKHSTRCSISSTALSRLERKWAVNNETIKPYYLDLIAFRDVSNAIALQFGVEHQSPQALVIKNGKAIFDASHFDIDYNKILSVI